MTERIRITPSTLSTMESLNFPFDRVPSVWAPENTVLQFGHGKLMPVFVWCYLKRHLEGPVHSYDPDSLSAKRVVAFPQSIRRLSEHCRFITTSSRTAYHSIWYFSRFLAWIDGKEHDHQFESILSDPDLALKAIEIHQRHMKSLVLASTMSRNSAANLDYATQKALGVIHDINFSNEIETISAGLRSSNAPKSDDIANLISTLTSVFDSAYRILKSHSDMESDGTWRLSLSAKNGDLVALPAGYSRSRLMDLAAVSFAALVFSDSGANLAQLRKYEEPHDLWEQLANPDRVSLTQKVVKFRAGGKTVPVTMTALTLSRLRHFCEVRRQMVELLDCADIAPLFFKCEFKAVKGRNPKTRHQIGCMEPKLISPLSDYFLSELRKKFLSVDIKLPDTTLKQLRAHKQQHLVRSYGLKIAADSMGHTIATAVKSYCAAQEGVQASDMGSFFLSLNKTVVERAQVQSISLVPVPAGECASHGNPRAYEIDSQIEPDCRNSEGCFFCVHFRVHADSDDLHKLLSCKHVLLKLGHLQGDSERADRLYGAVVCRIDVLLGEIRKKMDSHEFELVQMDIVAGKLTNYWTVKAQQLGLLGLINNSLQENRDANA